MARAKLPEIERRISNITKSGALSAKEQQVRALLAKGMMPKQIGKEMHISGKMVIEWYLPIFKQLSGATNHFQLICWAITGDRMAVARKLIQSSNKQINTASALANHVGKSSRDNTIPA